VRQHLAKKSARPWRSAIALLAIYFFALGAHASTADVVSVVSSDAVPYRQAQESLTKQLAANGHRLRPVTMENIAKSGMGLLGDASYVVAIGSSAAVWLHDHKPTMPLVYCMVSNPERAGLLTPPPAVGITTDVPMAEQMRLIKEALPNCTSVGVLYRENDAQSRQDLEAVRLALPMGTRLEAIAIDKVASPAAAIDDLLAKNVDVVWTCPDSQIWNEGTVRSMLLSALRRKVPVFGFSTAFVRAGALMGVGLDPMTQGAQAAGVVQDLIMGRMPENRVVAPTYDICLNLVVAQKLSLTLPKELQDRAKQIFGGGR
jgi:putative tryptophan/tyrosine transport system substrate-binding protein